MNSTRPILVFVVVATAKVQIFKQITTRRKTTCTLWLLLLLPQRYKFSSKSQLMADAGTVISVVVATAKVQIFKQITTWHCVIVEIDVLLLLPQRYKFSSKSQPAAGDMRSFCGCCCYRKGTNFQANHNGRGAHETLVALLLLPQRYKFSSKSQLLIGAALVIWSCCCYRKGTNFQANHNRVGRYDADTRVVVATAKVQIFKQITTWQKSFQGRVQLLLLPQRYKFSSKSQLAVPWGAIASGCCCYRKGTNFQANHNLHLADVAARLLLLLPQRYKFSSKSQLKVEDFSDGVVVVATAKVQIFKQITTVDLSSVSDMSCCCYRKGTNFQANHNKVPCLL